MNWREGGKEGGREEGGEREEGGRRAHTHRHITKGGGKGLERGRH